MTEADTILFPISSSWQTTITYEGAVAGARGAEPLVTAVTASPRFFRTVHISLLSGRDFAASDRAGQPPLVVISRSLAMRFFGTTNAVG